jgi:hypothetical protein
MWLLEAKRGEGHPVIEEIERQGTAWRRARRLYAAGFSVVATQFSIDDPPVPPTASTASGSLPSPKLLDSRVSYYNSLRPKLQTATLNTTTPQPSAHRR